MKPTQRPGRRTVLTLALLAGAAVVVHGLRDRFETRLDGPLGFTRLTQPRPLPALRFRDSEGRSLDLGQFRGKVVLLNVWATWCPPCRQEMPSLDRLQAALGSRDFEVVALSIDAGAAGPAAVRSFYRALDIRHLRLYHDAEAAALATLGVVGVPTTLLLDRQGRELGRMSGPAAWDGAEALALIKGQVATAEP